MVRLNSTGSMAKKGYAYYSYSTPIYQEFYNDIYGTIRVFNNTYYSQTTRKHQSYIKRLVAPDIILNNLRVGYWDLTQALYDELTSLNNELKELQDKKRLGKNQKKRISEIKNTMQLLRRLYKIEDWRLV